MALDRVAIDRCADGDFREGANTQLPGHQG